MLIVHSCLKFPEYAPGCFPNNAVDLCFEQTTSPRAGTMCWTIAFCGPLVFFKTFGYWINMVVQWGQVLQHLYV